jgi:hypothetical protein
MRMSMVLIIAMAWLTSTHAEESKPRFSKDAIQLFTELTDGYELNGQRVRKGNGDKEILKKLSLSQEPEVAEVAQKAPMLDFLQQLSQSQDREIQRAFEKQAMKWPATIAATVIQALGQSDPEKNDIRSAAKLLEGLMGSSDPDSPQQAVNRAWATTCLGNGLSLSIQKSLKTIGERGGPSALTTRNPISVTLNTNSPDLGTITLTNRTNQTLHHCLIFTRLEADRERINKLASEEDLVGRLILPGLGFSKATVEGSREAARLRYNFHAQDKGVMIYVPEIPANGKVTALLSQPEYFLSSRGAEMSLWCDELAIERQPAANWTEALEAVGSRRSRGRSGSASTTYYVNYWCNEWRESEKLDPIAAEKLADALARHGARVRIVTVGTTQSSDLPIRNPQREHPLQRVQFQLSELRSLTMKNRLELDRTVNGLQSLGFDVKITEREPLASIPKKPGVIVALPARSTWSGTISQLDRELPAKLELFHNNGAIRGELAFRTQASGEPEKLHRAEIEGKLNDDGTVTFKAIKALQGSAIVDTIYSLKFVDAASMKGEYECPEILVKGKIHKPIGKVTFFAK